MKRLLFIIPGMVLAITGMVLLYGDSATELVGDIQRRDRWFSLYIAMIGAGLYLVFVSLLGKGIRIWPGSRKDSAD